MKNAIKATTHFYFAQAVLKAAETNDYSIGDIFDCGEDTFLVSLYPFSNLIHRCLTEGEASDVLYSKFIEDAEQLGECFWEIVERDCVDEGCTLMPEIDEFMLDVNRVLLGKRISVGASHE